VKAFVIELTILFAFLGSAFWLLLRPALLEEEHLRSERDGVHGRLGTMRRILDGVVVSPEEVARARRSYEEAQELTTLPAEHPNRRSRLRKALASAGATIVEEGHLPRSGSSDPSKEPRYEIVFRAPLVPCLLELETLERDSSLLLTLRELSVMRDENAGPTKTHCRVVASLETPLPMATPPTSEAEPTSEDEKP